MNEITPCVSESRDGRWYFAGSKLKKKRQWRIWARATFLSAGDAWHDADAALPTPMTSTWWKLKTQLTIHPWEPVKLEVSNKFRSHWSAWLCFKNVLISWDTFFWLKFTTHHVSIFVKSWLNSTYCYSGPCYGRLGGPRTALSLPFMSCFFSLSPRLKWGLNNTICLQEQTLSPSRLSGGPGFALRTKAMRAVAARWEQTHEAGP